MHLATVSPSTCSVQQHLQGQRSHTTTAISSRQVFVLTVDQRGTPLPSSLGSRLMYCYVLVDYSCCTCCCPCHTQCIASPCYRKAKRIKQHSKSCQIPCSCRPSHISTYSPLSAGTQACAPTEISTAAHKTDNSTALLKYS